MVYRSFVTSFTPTAKKLFQRIFASKIHNTKRFVVDKIVINVLKMDGFICSSSFFTINRQLTMKKTLIYTNAVLTIIAAALTIIVLQNLEIIPKAHAAAPFTFPTNANGEVPVRVVNPSNEVQVTNMVKVNIEEVDGSSVWGKVPVVIKP